MKGDIVERLREKNRKWQEMADGWMQSAKDAGIEVGASEEAIMRASIDAEAAQEIEALREKVEQQIEELRGLYAQIYELRNPRIDSKLSEG